MANPLMDKSEDFSVRIVNLCERLDRQRQFTISKQLLRSGTSVGANIAEGQSAQSIADMFSKFKIAEKEARESNYWLKTLYGSGKLDEKTYNETVAILDEILRLLVASIKTLHSKLNRQ